MRTRVTIRAVPAAWLLAALLALVLAAPAGAGQIVYAHGGDLWVMNEDGSGRRPLASAAQIGGAIDAGSTADPQPVSVQPGGTGIAFIAPPGGSCGAQTSNCPALYSLIGGRLTRLTAPAAPCGSVSVQCGSEEEDPAVTADGRVVYDRLDVASAFICPFYCGFSGGFSEAFYARRLDGSDAPVGWSVPGGSSDPEGREPVFEGPIASDPADPSKLAYQGDFVAGLPETLYPVDVDGTATNPPSVTQPGFDDSFLYGLAFSGDGSLLADIETGGNKGIWVYPAGQDATSPGASFYWALEDPDNGRGTNLDHVLGGLAFAGQGALIFSANYNLYSLPARCWATPVGSTPQPNCHFPADATQLTSDGTAAAPDTSPAWTASTTPILALGATPPAPAPVVPGRNETGGRPTVHGARLSGVAHRRPRLTLTVGAAAGTKLRKLLLLPPRGIVFARSRRALRRGIVVRSPAGAALKDTLARKGSGVAITLPKGASKVLLRLGPPALKATRKLAAAAAAGKAGKLKLSVQVTDTGGHTTKLRLTLKPS